MKEAVVALVLMVPPTVLLQVPSAARAEGRGISLKSREVSFGRLHPGWALGSLVASPDFRRVAYWAERGGKAFVVVDGLEQKEYDFIGVGDRIHFSPDSRRVAYVAVHGDKALVVVDGEELGKEYDSAGFSTFSPDSRRVAYLAQRRGKVFLVVDGKEGKEYDLVRHRQISFSPDSKRVGYVAMRGGKEFVVVDGKEGKEYDLVVGLIFSPDSRRSAYAAVRGDKWFVVVDGKEGKTYDVRPEYTEGRKAAEGRGSVMVEGANGKEGRRQDMEEFLLRRGCYPSFSPNSKRLAYTAERHGKWFLVVDGREGKEYGWISRAPLSPLFSPDGKRVAYLAGTWGSGERRGQVVRSRVVVDGKEGMEYAHVHELLFSPDSRRLAYTATYLGWPDDGGRVVVDGREGRAYRRTGDLAFSPDSKRVAHTAWRGQDQAFVVVDGVEGKAYHGFLSGALLIFDSPTSFHTLGMREPDRTGDIAEIVRVEVEIVEE